MKACDFDEKSDAGADVSSDAGWTKALPSNLALKHVNVGFPARLGEALDREAVPRRDPASAGQAVIAERLEGRPSRRRRRRWRGRQRVRA
jgi:hypothetical protein